MVVLVLFGRFILADKIFTAQDFRHLATIQRIKDDYRLGAPRSALNNDFFLEFSEIKKLKGSGC